MRKVMFAVMLGLCLALLLPAMVLAQEAVPVDAPDGVMVTLLPGQLVIDAGTLIAGAIGVLLAGGGTVGGVLLAFSKYVQEPQNKLALERTYMSLPLDPAAREGIRDIIVGVRDGVKLVDELTDGVLPGEAQGMSARSSPHAGY